MKNFKIKMLLCLLIIGASLSVLKAQSINGTISGNILDNQGAANAGASVVVTNAETGASRNAETTDAGRFTVSGLPVGIYNVRIEKTGFAAVVSRARAG